MSFHEQVGGVIGKIFIQLAKQSVCQSQSSGHSTDEMMYAIFGNYHIFTKILCSLWTEQDIPSLKYLARYTGLLVFLTEVTEPYRSVIAWLVWPWLVPADPHFHLAC